MNPINYAEQLNLIASRGGGGIRATARRVGIGASTVVDYLKLLELNPKIREQVRKGILSFKDARTLARMKLAKEVQEKLGEIVETEGKAGLHRELQNMETGKKKRGIPKDAYEVVRLTYDKRWKPAMKILSEIDKRAEQQKMTRIEYIMKVLEDHVKG